MLRHRAAYILFLTLFSPATMLGQASSSGDTAAAAPSIRAIRVADAPPTIDGRLDEAVWSTAEAATGFTQLEPTPGAPASERTEARVLYDDEAVYVGMRLYDAAPDSIVAQLGRRDQAVVSDWAHVAFDSYHDRRTAFRFSVNPAGVPLDGFHYSDTEEDENWDAVWDVATRTDSLGWTAEFRIPLSQLRFSTSEADAAERPADIVWGVNFARQIARRNEMAFWAPVLPEVTGMVSRFGTLHGLRGLESPRNVEVVPYSVARLARKPGDADDPFHRPSDLFGTVGADLTYGVTSDLTLTATVNPDFGQVEADPAVVNLTAYETFLPEKRPFFVEGADIFRFGISPNDGDNANEQLFYSRRIGRRPQGSVPGRFSDAPDATTILGAAKLSGKTRDGWSIGFLDAVTGRETARYIDADGLEQRLSVEPLTNYAVGRLSRDFREGRSAVGAIATATNRRITSDGLGFLRNSAYTGGIDARHRFGGDDYEITGWLLGSHIRGTPEAISRAQRSSGHYFQRPDASHVAFDPDRTALSGWAARAQVGKISGGHWRWGAMGHAVSPGFEVNDLGYQRDADYAAGALYGGYTEFRPGPIFRRWRVNASQWSVWTFGRELVERGMNVNGSFQFRNFWGGYGGVNHSVAKLSTDALRGGPALLTPPRTNGWFGFHTDRTASLSAGLNINGSVEHGTDGYSISVGPSIDYRPSARSEISIRPSVSRRINPWQYIASRSTGTDAHYIFGLLDQRTLSLTTRLSYTFTPTLSLQFYGQPFVSAGGYTGFKMVDAPRAERIDDRFHRFDGNELSRDPETGRHLVDLDADGAHDIGFRDPDFNSKFFRSNMVLRWEYQPGSTLFVVWSQKRSGFAPDGSLHLRRDMGRLFGTGGALPAPATNVVLVKLNYWLGM